MSNTDDILFQPGDVLFDTTAPSTNAYFILEGSVELQLTLAKKKLTLKIEANQFVGDAAVVVTEKPSKDTLTYKGRAIALEPVRAVAIPIADIKQELDACPPLLKAWFTSFISRVLIVIEELSND
ncbi:MAG: cyclic nucleotide-binding domain-containing protein [Methylococcaceae bacterium]|nr:cyclic nucleotide-binding domain-containing protein [Methylococcaceae bacterium]